MKKHFNIYCLSILLTILICATCVSCQNADRYAQEIWDSSLPQEVYHSGNFKGYVSVYVVDYWENTKTLLPELYRVYKKRDGNYIISFEGNDYTLQRADPPFGEGPYALKWKFCFDHYIEQIPQEY